MPNQKKTYQLHGKSETRLYTILKGMIKRCSNPKTEFYHLYGGKGISICDEWLNDFLSFESWALANGYADNLSIDRINGDKNYTPDNCRWADSTTQNRNQVKQKNNTSGFIGIHWNQENKKWRSRITVNRKRILIGDFSTANAAAQAREDYIDLHNLTDFKRNTL